MKRLSSSGKPHKATKEKVVFKSCELFCNPIQWEKYLRLWFPTSGFTSILPPNSVKISLPLKTIHCSHWKAAAGAQVICPTKKKKKLNRSRAIPPNKFHPTTFHSHQEFTLTNCCISYDEQASITVLRPLISQELKNVITSSPREL